jgi:outer membrane biosynthesis protein TonB
VTEKKLSFFGSKKDSKSKDKEKEKEKEKESKEPKESVAPKQRPSSVQMPHPASFSTLYQLHQIQNGMMGTMSRKQGTFQRHHSQPDAYNMWHAKSYESGIGESS